MFLLPLLLVLHHCVATPYMKIRYQVNAETKSWRLDDLKVEYDAVEAESNRGSLSLYNQECNDGMYNYQTPAVVNITSSCKYRLLPPRPGCSANSGEIYSIKQLQQWTTCHPQASTEANIPGVRRKSLIGVPAGSWLFHQPDRSSWPCAYAVFRIVHTTGWTGDIGRVFDGMAYLDTKNAKFLNGSMVFPCYNYRCGRGDQTPGGSGLGCSYDADYKLRIMSKAEFEEDFW